MAGYGEGAYGITPYGITYYDPTKGIQWNEAGERLFETGIDRSVLYPKFGPGVVWNGLVSVGENVAGGETEELYYDGVKYLDVVASEDFSATIEAYSTPTEFAACDGSKSLSPGLYATRQPRKTFGLSYRTLIGNDLVGSELGYKLHLVWNCTCAPTAKNYQTIGSSVAPGTRQWTVNTVPEPASTYKPVAHLVVDSRTAIPDRLSVLEAYLYGQPGTEARLLTQAEVVNVMNGVGI